MEWKKSILELKAGNDVNQYKLDETEECFIQLLLAQNPDDRPQDVSEVLDVVDYLLEGEA